MGLATGEQAQDQGPSVTEQVPQQAYTCSWCGLTKKRMTIWQHRITGRLLYLCFHGCQNFPEPFEATGLTDRWSRVDPWQNYVRRQPKLSHSRSIKTLG